MTERLKFTVTYLKTVNMGNYNSEKFGVSKEYYMGETDVDDAFDEVRYLVNSTVNKIVCGEKSK